jgi:hypothetical protein
VALGERLADRQAVEHHRFGGAIGDAQHRDAAEAECCAISAVESGRRNAIITSANGAPVAFMASQARKLQLDQFLVPMTSV